MKSKIKLQLGHSQILARFGENAIFQPNSDSEPNFRKPRLITVIIHAQSLRSSAWICYESIFSKTNYGTGTSTQDLIHCYFNWSPSWNQTVSVAETCTTYIILLVV